MPETETRYDRYLALYEDGECTRAEALAAGVTAAQCEKIEGDRFFTEHFVVINVPIPPPKKKV